MYKHLARNVALAAVVTVLSITTVHAQSIPTPPPPPNSGSVTGGDPVPTSPDVVHMILVFLHLA
jgi:hypothetical protein